MITTLCKKNGTPAGTSHKTPGPKKRIIFKFSLKFPKTCKDIIIIDDAANSKHCHNVVAKEIAGLAHHKCFDFKPPDFKPSK